MRINYLSKRIEISTGIKIKPIFWNNKTKEFKSNCPNGIFFKNKLNSMEGEVLEYSINNKRLSFEDMANGIKGFI